MIRAALFFVALLSLCGCAGSSYRAVPVDSKTSYFPTSYTLKSEDLIVSKTFQLERYKQLLYVMVVDGGYEKGHCCERLYVPRMRFDIFFEKSFQEIEFSEQVQYIPQYIFERIIFNEMAEELEQAEARSQEFSAELAALKERHKEGAISDEEYMQKQREIVLNARYGTILPYYAGVSDLSDLNRVQNHYSEHLVVGILVKRKARALYRYTVDIKILDPATGDTVFHAHNERTIWNHVDQSLFYPVFNAFVDWVEKNSDRL